MWRTGLSSRMSRIITDFSAKAPKPQVASRVASSRTTTMLPTGQSHDHPNGGLGGARLLSHLSTSLRCVKAVVLFRWKACIRKSKRHVVFHLPPCLRANESVIRHLHMTLSTDIWRPLLHFMSATQGQSVTEHADRDHRLALNRRTAAGCR